MSVSTWTSLEFELDGYAKEKIANTVSIDIGYLVSCLVSEFEHYVSTTGNDVVSTNSPLEPIKDAVVKTLIVFLSRPRNSEVKENELELLINLIGNDLYKLILGFEFTGTTKENQVKIALRGNVFKDIVTLAISEFKSNLKETLHVAIKLAGEKK